MEIQIGQDIRKYKTKDIGNFSFREAAFLAAGAAVGYLTYKLSNSYETAVIPAGIILIFGFLKPYGMSFWQFIRTVVREKITPQCYINETDFVYDIEEVRELYGNEYVIPAEWNVIQTNTSAKIKKQDKEVLIP